LNRGCQPPWIIKPVEIQPDRKYPMVLKIHGGPRGAYGNTFFQTFHVLSGAGFFVLYVNPRRGSAYTTEFANSIVGRFYFSEDWLKGVDTAISKYEAIDPKRVGVAGGSYGGLATNWLTATTDRFAAAVTSRTYANLESFWGTTDIPHFAEYYVGGKPWENRELYRKLSPFYYVEKITAPTFIIRTTAALSWTRSSGSWRSKRTVYRWSSCAIRDHHTVCPEPASRGYWSTV
jgi:dipeptidyl aminopeptidase/acylaminoacyl peptidase